MVKSDKNKQENLMKLQVMAQEANELDQQLQLIEQHINDMDSLNEGLEGLENTKSKDILANIGKGIYIPAEIKDKELFVEIGQKTVVKKSIPDAKIIIKSQIEKLNSAKLEVMSRVEGLQREMSNLMDG
jgi:prefoldin alpha subunit